MNKRASDVEWPTVALIAGNYLVLCLLVWFHASLPWWIIAPIGAYCAALHGSLQHEALHGHPTRNRFINDALVTIAPHLWLPYPRYRKLHLTHHNDEHLTDPVLDPESYYLLPGDWKLLGGFRQMLYTANNTLAGRMIMGPAISVIRFWGAEFRLMLRGDMEVARGWLSFALGSAAVVWFVVWVAGMPFWQYVLLIAYPGVSLALVRSFCEHQAAENAGHRTIIVEASPFWSLLFLFNNLHLAHHARPTLAWYRIPAFYRAEKADLIARNNGYAMKGYGEIFRRYFFRAKEPVEYPDIRWLKSAKSEGGSPP
jgi:fatty acid desaturase